MVTSWLLYGYFIKSHDLIMLNKHKPSQTCTNPKTPPGQQHVFIAAIMRNHLKFKDALKMKYLPQKHRSTENKKETTSL
jgi:hypothetical protein